ncbi:redoxin domain-containing protein [Nonomuraea sp. NPDC050786]|uniref:TlpA family protein disulfide reductase n=1 Tax=Nonomuraea sp. NPDC050786 TaxID=3154840 RepID=UPI0033D272F0
MFPVRTAVAMAATALLAVGCSGAGQREAASGTASAAATSITTPTATSTSAASQEASVTPVPTASQEAAAGKAPVPAALRFSARTLDGADFQGASLAGRPVVFWFWAPWCPKCLSEAPAVKAVAGKYGEVAFVGVAGLDTEAAMKEFVQRTGTGNLVHLSDAKGVAWTKLGVSQQSTFVFMKPDGSTEKASGPLSQDKLDEHLRELLGR